MTATSSARSGSDIVFLVALALLNPSAGDLLERAAALAATTQDRQLVAIAAAHIEGDADLVQALARDHLADFPGSVLAAWIAVRRRAAPSEHRARSEHAVPSDPPAPTDRPAPTNRIEESS